MDITMENKKILGVNGLGRIGKLTLWYHLAHKDFDGIVINLGREAGRSLEDLLDNVLTDSTYGNLARFLYGFNGSVEARIIDSASGQCEINGIAVKFLREARNPKDINWRSEGVRLVVDTTGRFLDPSQPADSAKGSCRGHLEAGAQKVIVSAPFKFKSKAAETPEDSAMLIYGINHTAYEPSRHHVVSAASCTTTGLAHMLKPLLETEETSHILTASMSTLHAATKTQQVLDSMPASGAKDLRKNRSVMNNIILSTTGAAIALEKVMPEISRIGFMADSVRIPTNTVSLINLNLTFQSPLDGNGEPKITRNFINNIYKEAGTHGQKGLLHYSEKQNVSNDLIGFPAAVVIEGHDTHTRTGFIDIKSDLLVQAGIKTKEDARIPVTHAKLFGWYDNEMGSYVNCLGRLTEWIYKNSC